MTWWRRRMAAFDTETTSPDPTQARIVSAALVFGGGGEPTEKRSWLIDPGVEIPAEATAVHGITTEQARADGAPAAVAIQEIAHGLVDAWALFVPVVIANAPYDLTVISAEVKRLELIGFGVVGQMIDPMVLDKRVDKYRKGKRNLSALAAHYEVTHDGAHDSAADALAAARVAYRIGQLFPAIGNLSLAELHAAQVGWYAEQARGLADHWRRTGDARVVDSFEWPVRRAA